MISRRRRRQFGQFLTPLSFFLLHYIFFLFKSCKPDSKNERDGLNEWCDSFVLVFTLDLVISRSTTARGHIHHIE